MLPLHKCFDQFELKKSCLPFTQPELTIAHSSLLNICTYLTFLKIEPTRSAVHLPSLFTEITKSSLGAYI